MNEGKKIQKFNLSINYGSPEKITTSLWFVSNAEEAANLYTKIFKSSKIGRIASHGKAGFEVHGRHAGSVMTVEFQIEGENFVGLNGGPHFKFNEAISFIVDCKTQEELSI